MSTPRTDAAVDMCSQMGLVAPTFLVQESHRLETELAQVTRERDEALEWKVSVSRQMAADARTIHTLRAEVAELRKTAQSEYSELETSSRIAWELKELELESLRADIAKLSAANENQASLIQGLRRERNILSDEAEALRTELAKLKSHAEAMAGDLNPAYVSYQNYRKDYPQ